MVEFINSLYSLQAYIPKTPPVNAPLKTPLALGRALRDARRARGLTQGETAIQAGISQPTVSKVERGESSVSLNTLLRLLAVYELDLTLRARPASPPRAPWDEEL